jgi:hypothetical protein
MMKRLTIAHPLDRRVAIGSIEHVLARLRSATAAERQPGKLLAAPLRTMRPALSTP